MKSILTVLLGGEPVNPCFDDEGGLGACSKEATPTASFSTLESMVMLVSVIFALLILVKLASRQSQDTQSVLPTSIPPSRQ